MDFRDLSFEKAGRQALTEPLFKAVKGIYAPTPMAWQNCAIVL